MIEIKNISKTFNPHFKNKNQVLKDVSFNLPDVGLISIFGKSGSGKTTMLNIIGGLEKQDSGDIIVNGINTKKAIDKIRNKEIGYIFQNYLLEKGYSVGEILRNQMLIAGFKDENEINRRIDIALDLVDMKRFKNKAGDALSGGQQQRVAIARAIVKGANIILADEPTGNLDSENTTHVMDILKKISKTKLVVLVTHELYLIKQYADNYIMLTDGELKNNDLILDSIDYEKAHNELDINSLESKEIKDDNLSINLYGNPITNKSDITIINDKGRLYLKASNNINIINENSEKQIKEEKTSNNIDINNIDFYKSESNRNGKLFHFKDVLKVLRNDNKLSVSNAFKYVFIMCIALIVICMSFYLFEIIRSNPEHKEILSTALYEEVSSYKELSVLDEEEYKRVDFFQTSMNEGKFAFKNTSSLSSMTLTYAPKAIETDTSLDLLYGSMPSSGEVVITEVLATKIKNEIRVSELQNDKALLQLYLDETYKISGIVSGEESRVYFTKLDYVNFLGVYNNISINDSYSLFLKDSYKANKYSATIALLDDGTLSDHQVIIEVNRNSLYKMMSDTANADYYATLANKQLETMTTATYIDGSEAYIKKYIITRDVMNTDLIIYVNSNVLNNIFTYIPVNLDTLSTNSNYYFEVQCDSIEQMNTLNEYLTKNRGIYSVDVNAYYQKLDNETYSSAKNTILIFCLCLVLVLFIYYFIEKSSSVKDSKEYGILRAIGVNKSNLIFKECLKTLLTNIICFIIFMLIFMIILTIRYNIINVAPSIFILISILATLIFSVLMTLISLIPYLFVLYQMPANILAKYDI